jgi:hypothetical protein
MTVEVQAVLRILLGLAGMIFNNVKRQRVNSSSQDFKLKIKLRLKLDKNSQQQNLSNQQKWNRIIPSKIDIFLICGSLTNNSSFQTFKKGAY